VTALKHLFPSIKVELPALTTSLPKIKKMKNASLESLWPFKKPGAQLSKDEKEADLFRYQSLDLFYETNRQLETRIPKRS